VEGNKPLEKTVLMSDTSSDTMTPDKQDEKQGEKITVRLGVRLNQLAQSLAREHGADDFSDYVRGLIVHDAVTRGKSLSGIATPGWLQDDLVELRLVQPNPRSSETSPPGGKESEGGPNESSRGEGKNKSSKKIKHSKIRD
jgi:hypothetical protein